MLVPQHEAPRFQSIDQSQHGRRLQGAIRLVAFLQPVIGDHRIEMMNMVKSDIAAEPLQESWELEVGTAAQRCGC